MTYEVNEPGKSDYWSVVDTRNWMIVAMFHKDLPNARKLAHDLEDLLNRPFLQ